MERTQEEREELLIRKNISKWYQGCGILGLSQEQYQQRLEGIAEFAKRETDISVCGELAKSFMGMQYDIGKLSGFINIFNEGDITFSEENTREISLLAGVFLFVYVRVGYVELAVMLLLLDIRGCKPCQREIFERIMAVYSKRSTEMRKAPKWENVKLAAFKKISEGEKEYWGTGADYVSARLAEQYQYIKAINANFNVLKEQLEYKQEESDLLWWMVAGWSDIYNCSFEALGDKQAALAAPFEIMDCVSWVPSPIATEKIIKKALSGKGLEKKYAVKDYISAADEKIFSKCEYIDYDFSDCVGFVPILELLQLREQLPGQDELPTVYKLFGKKYDAGFLDCKLSVFEFASQLFYECELMELIKIRE